MDIDRNGTFKGQIVLIDPYIHKKAKLTKEQFIERVKYVKYLRTASNSFYISFYITSLDENNNLIKFHELVNHGIFDFDNYHVFAVAIQPKLYNWFKTTNITTIQQQIAAWLAGCYYFNLDKREIQKKQIYKPLLEEILEIVETYYKDFPIPNFEDEKAYIEINKCKKKYIQVCKDYYKTEPPEFLSSPFDYEYLQEWGVNNYYNFEFVEAYFNEGDWKRIVIEGKSQDDMHRSESLDDLWLKWKHVYTTFDQRRNFVYSFYFEPRLENKRASKPIRENIPQHIKNQVWQRDNGLCVECGSNEKLEFDHIIPFSKGGSSTYRTLQLLCEPCNRKKYNKI